MAARSPNVRLQKALSRRATGYNRPNNSTKVKLISLFPYLTVDIILIFVFQEEHKMSAHSASKIFQV